MKTISYDPCWKKLIDLKWTKGDLCEKAGVSRSTITKMGKNEIVSLDMIVKMCNAMDCELWDVMELVPAPDDTPTT